MLHHRHSSSDESRAPQGRKPWVTPQVRRIVAGSAEALTRDGQPDGGGPGQSRS